MFKIFGKNKSTQLDKLYKQYEKLTAEAYKLSTSNRTASDSKYAEADLVLKKIDALKET
jgi:hypothetical protein